MKFPEIVKNPAPHFKQFLDENDGLIQVRTASSLAYMTDRPELIRHVLQKNNKNYRKSKVVREVLGKQIGNGLLTSDGEYWLQQRRAIQPGFHRKRLQGISRIMIDEIQHYLDNRFDKLADTGEVFDMSKEMTYLAFKVVSRALFGENVPDEELAKIDQTVSKGQQLIIDEVRKPFIKLWLVMSGRYKEVARLKSDADQIILQIIKDRKESGQRSDDLVDMLLETRYEDGTGMTDKQLLDEAVILYVAGHETSAIAMTWAWYMIASNPEVEQKLLDSVTDTLGDENPSFEKLREMSYSLQVLEETMRLYPPAWIVDREPINDDVFGDIRIKKGREVLCLIYSVHRNAKYWENPEQFDPERFTPENKKKQVPYSYMPFGGGPRLCIGNNFALMEMQFVLAMMVRRYKIELVKDQKIDINPMITLRPRNGLKVRVSRRD